ncbi:hypothetical protein [Robertmurraya massiliosenegalensis]|uniref:hypothetical protein n=1 Tax=Robertmurraya massiliosenegalensis TaxID=1287657 RepID=UPI0002E82CD1|nr:hypothetical protein [Robertmurraya massiliosenegalensis]
MEIEQIDMREALEREFRDDPIYKMCLINKLDDEELFPESILSMHHETSYGTVEAGKILNRPDSTIRNHFRTDLIDYIAPERFGKYYRMDFKSVFRLHLVFLLIEKRGKSTVDLLVELGYEPAVVVGKGRKGVINKSTDLEAGYQQEQEQSEAQELRRKVEQLTEFVEGIMYTGLFQVIDVDGKGTKQIALKDEFAQKLLESSDRAADIEKILEENEKLKKQMEALEESNHDIAIKIRKDRLEKKVKEQLEIDALNKWTETSKATILARIFQSEKIELEKIKFVNEYVEKHINERLNNEIKEKILFDD